MADLKTLVSLEDYLEQEFHAKTRHEYVHEEIIPMPYTSRKHGRIATNLFGTLYVCSANKNHYVYAADRMLSVPVFDGTHNLYYPDLMVVEGEEQCRQLSENMEATVNPVLLVEILSASNADNDLVDKMTHYKTIPSLKQYLIVWQNEIRAELYTRTDDPNQWLNTIFTQNEEICQLLGCQISLAQMYAKTTV
jgi:Uma2 family endonuclease